MTNLAQSKYSKSSIALLLANSIPLFGVFILGWDVFAIILLYWLENVIVGVFNVLKMATNQAGGLLANNMVKLFIIPFFCFHYGMFCFVHGMFVMFLFGDGLGHGGSPSDLFRTVDTVLTTNRLSIAVLSIIISHAISFATNYIGKKEYKHIQLQQLMAAPYKRIALLHLVIIASGFLVMLLGQPKIIIVLFVLIKTVVDFASHNKEHVHRVMENAEVIS